MLIFGFLLGASLLVSLALLLAGSAGVISSLALLAAAYVANLFAGERLESAIRWRKGGNGEAKVGALLDTLRHEEFVVMHDLDKVVAGNIDHLVVGPTGAFMVETKFRRYDDRDLPKAKRTAAMLANELGSAWVQPVICFATRSYGPRNVRGVTVVGVDGLLSYIRSQNSPVVPCDRLARFADSQ